MKFPLYRKQKTVSEKTLSVIYSYQMVILYLVINFLFITSLSDTLNYPLFVKIILPLILISGFGFPIYVRLSKNPLRIFGTETGEIDLLHDGMEISIYGDKKIKLSQEDIAKLSIHYKILGLLFPVYRLNISVVTETNTFDLEMNIKSIQKHTFVKWLEYQYENGVLLQEFDGNGLRAFLLNANLDYQQIQDVKKHYQIEWNLTES